MIRIITDIKQIAKSFFFTAASAGLMSLCRWLQTCDRSDGDDYDDSDNDDDDDEDADELTDTLQ